MKLRQVVQRVDERAVALHAEVAVRAAGDAGAADVGDGLTLVDVLPRRAGEGARLHHSYRIADRARQRHCHC